MKKFSLAAAVLGVCLAFGGAGYAQCGSDDGFDTGCCTLPAPSLPNFPAMTMTANWAELRGCTPTNLNTVTVALTPPTMVFCDYALIGVNVLFASGESMSGTVAAKYARTWFELPAPAGQTYRFLINGDFSVFPNAAATPCTSQLPRCAFVAGQQVHFDGHIDYRCVPGTILPTTASMSLSHHQGCLTHAPWSCLPMTGLLSHVESSWHLVGPAPFTFGTGVPAPAGPIIGDAVRTSLLQVVPAFNYQCISEIKMLPGGSIGPGAASTCSCATTYACSGSAIPCPAAVACYEPTNLNFGTCCATGSVNGPFNLIPIPGTPIAATGMLALRLGTWGALPQYPAGTSLTVYWGVVNFTTAFGCVQPLWNAHATVGVATRNFFAQPFASTTSCAIPPASTAFIDLQNCLPLNSAFPNPGYGCLAASDVLWSFNTP